MKRPTTSFVPEPEWDYCLIPEELIPKSGPAILRRVPDDIYRYWEPVEPDLNVDGVVWCRAQKT